jgi:tRNA G18 (ribose-2'-O)-methylase SpoU
LYPQIYAFFLNFADMKDRKLLNIELGRISPAEYKELPPSGLAVVLDNIRSAHNVGSAFRTADSFGIDRVFLCGISAVPPSAEIHKSALGAEDSVPWEHVDDTLEAVRRLQSDGWTVVAVEQTVHSLKLGSGFHREPGRKYALVFGNEVSGVRQDVVDACDLSLEIPQYGTKHSLNVSVSVGVVLWEMVR